MKPIYKIISALTIVTLLSSCSGGREENTHEEPELEAIAVTQWTDSMELFMEYDPMIAGHKVKFIIHLTTLSDFQPVREGRVRLSFTDQNGKIISEEVNTLLREGIFTPQIALEQTGRYDFTLSYSGQKAEETFLIGPFEVYASEEDVPVPESDSVPGITFLKEQQWKIDFSTEPVVKRQIRPSITALGLVKPVQNRYSLVSSPVNGIIDNNNKQALAIAGQRVARGDVLAVLMPPFDSENTWLAGQHEYVRAGKDYERALRLQETESISQREFEAIEQKYLSLKAGYESMVNRMALDSQTLSEENGRLLIRSPLSGVVGEVWTYQGQNVNSNERLMSVFDPSRVWISVQVSEKDVYRIGSIEGLSLTIPGLDEAIHFDRQSMVVVAESATMNVSNRTVDVLIDVENVGGMLKIGQSLMVRLYLTGGGIQLAIPTQSIFEDQGLPIVYIHSEGESFEKRIVKTSFVYQDWTGIETGLSENERVVTSGGYLIKLASTSEVIGHAHTH